MPDADELVANALAAVRGTDVRQAERQLDQLMVGTGAADGTTAVDAALLRRLVRGLGRLWPRGWQPADVDRITSRRLDARAARLVRETMAVQRREQSDPVPAWFDEQLRGLVTEVRADDENVLASWSVREALDRADALRAAVDVLALVESLPPIAVLRPPPGTTGAATARPAGTRSGSPMLDRVRALLAKAESTTFPAEAEALTGKAQELIARHSIDEALLAAGSERGDLPGGVRLSTDTPYAGAKALLVQEVAAANRCEAVWSDDLGFATVLGWPADLVAVELLYTSLLVQATAAMLRGRAERRAGSGRRTKVWDESFLNAFALRIGERLRAATEAATNAADQAAAETAGAERLLPVLAARGEAVRERLDTLFPGVTRHRLSVRDAEGWSSGTSAADRASLEVGGGRKPRQVPGRPDRP
ncbi:DUF2786 domain-containing protein [Micromonospora parathelypteridis]|uniref:DUF2786 domain-containing protein n=1 Tax=Micromonospora parathelypteridis TaxID=1839617 RepID=A0A840VY57_9ACTN|nr:DUF2786 domain-containing protein [Micromonospora parathelypteridis]MBB5478814.1 hypothetical protein [Micromonospora parathelypteridis]GGO04406.1 hypothetical protein GCM10011576_05910 [Micromonospora parathelypteridis]